jgi:hypothetical protein
MQGRERRARFTLSRHIRPILATYELVHFGGHVMLQSRKRSHVEAFSGRIDPYGGHGVENELVKRDFFVKKTCGHVMLHKSDSRRFMVLPQPRCCHMWYTKEANTSSDPRIAQRDY